MHIWNVILREVMSRANSNYCSQRYEQIIVRTRLALMFRIYTISSNCNIESSINYDLSYLFFVCGFNYSIELATQKYYYWLQILIFFCLISYLKCVPLYTCTHTHKSNMHYIHSSVLDKAILNIFLHSFSISFLI